MKTHIITNWENDLIEAPEPRVAKFVADKYKGFDLKLLSGMRHREKEEIYETLQDSFVIIMETNLLDERQVEELVKQLSHPIWINFNSNVNNLSVRSFIFLCSTPFDDLVQIKRICRDLKDDHNEHALTKIVKCVPCHFYGNSGEHYEMLSTGYYSGDICAIRHK